MRDTVDRLGVLFWRFLGWELVYLDSVARAGLRLLKAVLTWNPVAWKRMSQMLNALLGGDYLHTFTSRLGDYWLDRGRLFPGYLCWMIDKAENLLDWLGLVEIDPDVEQDHCTRGHAKRLGESRNIPGVKFALLNAAIVWLLFFLGGSL